jgi:predicted lipoprotein with Yx(FWY)xxD motif
MQIARTRGYAWASAGLVSVGLLTAACSSSSSTPSSSGGSTTSATSGATGGSSTQATIKTESTNLGTLLADAQGLTVYTFAADTSTASHCTGACAAAWPPVTVNGTPTAASGIPGTLGTITRAGGVKQVTWNGHPLYTFKVDTASGQVNGNGVTAFGAKWYAITSSGTVPASSSSPSSSGGGGYGY